MLEMTKTKQYNAAQRRSRRLITTGAVVLGLMAGGGVAGAASAESEEPLLAKPCGYSESEGGAWYNHCTTDGSRIQIKIDVVADFDRYRCVDPGVTTLGPDWQTRNAYYTGVLCPR